MRTVTATRRISRRRRPLMLTLLVLPALLLRALIPAGFMPAHDAPLALEICPEGFPAGLLLYATHHHHQGTRGAHGDHCLFGGAGGNGPPLQANPSARI